MGKNIWLIGILVLVLIIQAVPLSQIEGIQFDFDQRQQDRGQMADQLYLTIFIIVGIIAFIIGYIALYIGGATNFEDIKENASNNFIMNLILKIFLGAYKETSAFIFTIGLVLFFLLLTIIIFYITNDPLIKENASSFGNILNIILFMIVLALFFVTYKYFELLKDYLKIGENSYQSQYFHGFLLVLALGFIVIGTIPQMRDMGLGILLLVGLLLFVFLFLLFSEDYKYLLKILHSISRIIFGITFIIVSILVIIFITEGPFLWGIILGSVLLLYILLLVAHLIYFHGFSASGWLSFIKYMNPPIMDTIKLKKSPLYVLCEGILFEPFYKFGFLKNRSIINNWHMNYSLKDGPVTI